MAIVNRDLDASQQKEVVQYQTLAGTVVSTGTTLAVWCAPYPCVIQSARVGTLGVSGAPQARFIVQRMAAGLTILAVGSTSLMTNLGLSGMLGHSGVMSAGTTLLTLQANDVLGIETAGGSATAAIGVVAQIVVKKLQDIVSHNGISS